MLHILIVDDSPATREITAEQVRALGYRASEAGDGPAALALAERERYDVVLMDLRMPGMDGIETARRLIARCGPARPRIVALSAGDRGDRERCLAAGLDDFLARPASLSRLRAALAGGAPPPVQPAARPAGLDTAYVDELLAAIGPADLRRAAAPFISETPQLITALNECAGRDAEAAYRLAHLIKGRALSLGATALAAEAAAIERLATERAAVGSAQLAALGAAFADAVTELRAYLARRLGPGDAAEG